MVTKEQCLLNRILESVDYSGNGRLAQAVVSAYNSGKKYASDMIFQNDERGLDQGLEGFSPSFIVYSLVGEDNEYNPRDPFFVIENGIKSIDGYDFRRMLKPEDSQRLLVDTVLEQLDDSDVSDAFDEFVRQNYPQEYNALDLDELYDLGYRTGGHILEADWNQLVKELQQNSAGQGQVMEMTEEELREIVAEGTKKVYEQLREANKSGIHIDPENKGKFTATKKRTGESTSKLLHSPNKKTRARANFARMAKRGWKPLDK